MSETEDVDPSSSPIPSKRQRSMVVEDEETDVLDDPDTVEVDVVNTVPDSVP